MTFKNLMLAVWWRASFSSTLFLGAMLASSLALAAEEQMEEIHTHADRSAESIVGWSSTGKPVKKVTMQYHVRYDDLDLASRSDVDTLRKRVTVAALMACTDLGKKHSNLGFNWSCSTAARRSARLQVDRAIAQFQAGE